jgi:hypothetical protein
MLSGPTGNSIPQMSLRSVPITVTGSLLPAFSGRPPLASAILFGCLVCASDSLVFNTFQPLLSKQMVWVWDRKQDGTVKALAARPISGALVTTVMDLAQ